MDDRVERTLSPADVATQLERMLSSQVFAGCERSQQFLRYVVEEAMANRAGYLKGVTLATQVFGLDDPEQAQNSTVVRVEAGRLRRRLDDYYRGEGLQDPIRIGIPKGTYVPVFETSAIACEVPVPPPSDHHSAHVDATPRPDVPAWRRLYTILIVLMTTAAAIWWFSLPETSRQDRGITRSSVRIVTAPSIMVFPFENDMTTPDGHLLAKGVTEDIITDLSRVPGLDLIALASVLSLKESMSGYVDIAHRVEADFILRGSLRSDEESEQVRITAQLFETKTGIQIWADRFDRKPGSHLALQAELAQAIAQSTVAAIPEIEYSLQSQAGIDNPEANALYKEAIQMVNPPLNPGRLLTARRAFEHVINLEPNWAGGYAGVAYTSAFYAWWGHSKQPDEDLARAHEYAERALALDDLFGLADSAHAFAYLAKRDFDNALKHSARSVKSQPNDPYVHAYHGFMLTVNGDAAAGLPFLDRALRLDPYNIRSPFLNISGLINFHAGNPEKAAELYLRNVNRGGPLSLNNTTYRAVSLAAAGRIEEARAIYEMVQASRNEFDHEDWVRRTFRREEDVAMVMEQVRRIRSE